MLLRKELVLATAVVTVLVIVGGLAAALSGGGPGPLRSVGYANPGGPPAARARSRVRLRHHLRVWDIAVRNPTKQPVTLTSLSLAGKQPGLHVGAALVATLGTGSGARRSPRPVLAARPQRGAQVVPLAGYRIPPSNGAVVAIGVPLTMTRQGRAHLEGFILRYSAGGTSYTLGLDDNLYLCTFAGPCQPG